MTEIDWSQAPEWARWWAIGGSHFDKGERARWYEYRPKWRNRGRCEYGYITGGRGGQSKEAPLFSGSKQLLAKRP